MTFSSFFSKQRPSSLRMTMKHVVGYAACLVLSSAAWAVDISDVPLPSANTTVVKPNIFFVLDDSGSMGWAYMPDAVDTGSVGYRTSTCNLVYYNPATNYVIPKDYNGDDVNKGTQTSFTAAYTNGFSCYTSGGSSPETCTSSGTTNLSTSTSNNYYWVYAGTGTPPEPLSTECNYSPYSSTTTTGICNDGSSVSNSPPTCGSGKTLLWKKVTVSSTSGTAGSDERQNFANWYSYYRTRLNMMKSASGRAFGGLSSSYRLGFMTIHPGTVDSYGTPQGGSSTVGTSKFLKIDDFASTHRRDWFRMLYSQSANGNTPLRTALSIAGRYYAGKSDGINAGAISSDNPDPVQYSCQQNFTILTTDGYWNSGDGYKLDGETIMDNQDGNAAEMDPYNTPASKKFAMAPRPIFDGASTTVVTTDKSNLYRWGACTAQQPQQRIVQNQSRTIQIQKETFQKQQQTTTYSACRSNGTSCQTLSFDCTVSGTGSSTRPLCRVSTGAWTNVSSCTTAWNVACRTTDTGWVNTNSCTPSSSGGTTVYCMTTVVQDWHNVGSCTASNPSSGPNVECQVTSDTGWQNVSSCTASNPSTGPTTTCQNVATTGSKLQVQTTTTTTTTVNSDVSGTPTTTSSTGSWGDVSPVTCYLPASVPSLPSPNPQPATTGMPSGCSAWPCTTTTSSGGSSNTLADVTQYYYKTDLRPAGTTGAGGIDVSENNVRAGGTGTEDDRVNWQHMTTFTMGLGLSGTLNFSQDYKTAATGVFQQIRGVTTPVLDWPIPSSGDATTLDDLWHAAVNGRGRYFSAGRPDDVIIGLNSALSSIQAINGSGAASATASVDQASGKNFLYKALYKTQVWTGEITAFPIDPTTSVVGTTVIWSAQNKLSGQVGNACDNRNIKLFHAGATDNLVDFTWNTSVCDSSGAPTGTATTGLDGTEKANFSATQVALLSQYSQMTNGSSGTIDQKTAAVGANLVNFLRGQRGLEGFAPNTNLLYRTREHPFGDIVSSKPLYAGPPSYIYADAGYADWIATDVVKNRKSMLYVAANDGMVHALYAGETATDADGGKEAWAFIPTSSLSNMYKLADTAYATNHQYFVDGAPAYGDVYDPTALAWKSILVGGLNKGGKIYYALDITDPTSPKALWEFSDSDLGYTYGNPEIAKLPDGRWAVFFGSGYNNTDGQGYLYAVDAITGSQIAKISLGASSSGLAKIAHWANSPTTNNTAIRIYGGDMLGNIWRFKLSLDETTNALVITKALMGIAKDASGNVQPITTRPVLAVVNNNPYVYVGTGRYLGTTDLTDVHTQSVYAIKDTLTDTPIDDLRATLSQRTITSTGTGVNVVRTVTLPEGQTCDANNNGWYADLPVSGERVNVDWSNTAGTLTFYSNVPQNSACSSGGISYVNYLDYATGCASAASTGAVTGGFFTNALVVGATTIINSDTGSVTSIATDSFGNITPFTPPTVLGTPQGKRVSWREVFQ